jgi:glycosyltransferase involved in cell wall biosynthesis
MKILINALSARLGGGQTYLTNLLSHLPDRADFKILIYAPKTLKLPNDHRIERLNTNWPTENPLLRALWEKIALPKIILKKKVTVLFCPGGIVTTSAPAGCKTVTTFQNMIPFDPAVLERMPFSSQRIRNIILKPLMLQSMKNSDLTIFISNHARRIIERLTTIRNSKTIPHGLSESFRTYLLPLERPAWVPKSQYLLYVSRFDIYKHQLEVATAFASLPTALNKKYKLLFVGEVNSKLGKPVMDLAERSNLQEQICIVGPVTHADLPALYHHATINIFASSCENCPNILIEALGAGRPVLSSNVMPMPEFGLNAVEYFTPTEPETIRDAMLRVLQNADRLEELAANANQRSTDFDWKVTARETWSNILSLQSK